MGSASYLFRQKPVYASHHLRSAVHDHRLRLQTHLAFITITQYSVSNDMEFTDQRPKNRLQTHVDLRDKFS
jgi:hypothetical protein